MALQRLVGHINLLELITLGFYLKKNYLKLCVWGCTVKVILISCQL